MPAAGRAGQEPALPARAKRDRGGGLPRLAVVAWVGDNILDFPALTQATRDDSTALGEFGKRFFIIPNPMYGSWEHLK